MPVRTRGAASAMPATHRSRSHTPVAVNVAAEETARFGVSHLTQVMREDLRRTARVPAPALPDADALAEMVRQRDEDARRRHLEEDRRVKREYDAYLAGRAGREMPDDDDAFDDEHEPLEDDVDRAVPVTRNPVRDRLEREAAQTREATTRPARRTRSEALAVLEAEADVAARTIRDSAPARRPTSERLVAPPPVARTSMAVSREDALLVDDDAATEPDTDLTARQCTLADVDRLWDWIRAEPDTGIRFIGRPLANSQQLHVMMTTIAKGEAQRASLARSIYFGDDHAGFVILLPIVMADKMAAVHMYLRAESRGLLPVMLPSLLALARDVMPDVKLAVMGMPPSFGKLLEPCGFAMQTVFLQE